MLVSFDDSTKSIVLCQQHHHIVFEKLDCPPADSCQVFPQFVGFNVLHVILPKAAILKQPIDILALHSTGRNRQLSMFIPYLVFFVESFVHLS